MPADGATDPIYAREDPEESDPVEALRERANPVLRAAPHSTFFHIVALLERLTKENKRIGGDGPASEEGIRFRHDYDLGFSAGDIARVEVKALPRRAERGL